MFKYLFLPWILLISLSVAWCHAQRLRFDHLSADDGLSQSTILCIEQDRLGFLWIGTADGLNKYDGYEFKTFRHDPADSSSISDNEVMAVYDDQQGNIWIGTANGIDVLNVETEKCSHFEHDPLQENSLSDNYVTTIFKDLSGTIWVGTANGLNQFDNTSNTFKRHYPKKDTLSVENVIRSVFETKEGVLLVGSDGGLMRFDRNQNRFDWILEESEAQAGKKETKVNAILQDDKGRIWVGGNNGLMQFSSDLKEHKAHYGSEMLGLGNNYVRCLMWDERMGGVLWVGTEDGLNRFNIAKEMFVTDRYNPKDKHSLSNNTIHSMFCDDTGILWVGTGSGLNKFDRFSFQFNPVLIHPTEGNDLVSNKVWALYQGTDNMLWVGTEGGLHAYNTKTEKVTGTYKASSGAFGLSSNIIRTITSSSEGGLWLGTEGGGLNRLDAQQRVVAKFFHDANDSSTISDDVIRSIARDDEGILWLGTSNGLNKFDESSEKSKRYYFGGRINNTMKINSIRHVIVDHQKLLIATEGGLIVFNKSDESYEIFEHHESSPSTLSHNFVRTIFKSNDGIVWLGTSGGLNRFDPVTKTFKSYRMKNGMPNDVVYGILQDDTPMKCIWISTNKGVAKFDPDSERFKSYDIYDGLQSFEFNTNASFKNHDGTLMFGGINGFNKFKADEIIDNPFSPPIILTGFEIFNQKVKVGNSSPLKKSIVLADTVFLSYADYLFTFRFSALNFFNPERNKYKYILQGFDEQWNEVGNRRYATYTNIPGGTYLFKVNVSNHTGGWSEMEKQIVVVISTPFWKKTWFNTGLILLSFLLGYGFYQIRIKTVEKKKQKLESLVNARTREISEQKSELEKANKELNEALSKLKEAQTQLIQSEKMASLGQLTAGVAHEINNPVNFIFNGINGLDKNLKRFIEVNSKYEKLDLKQNLQNQLDHISEVKEALDYDGVKEDIMDLLPAIKEGADRTARIVKGLQSFAWNADAEFVSEDIHKSLDSTLVLLSYELKDNIQVIKKYCSEELVVGCLSGQLNQVFMNIITNAIQAIGSDKGVIEISTANLEKDICVTIKDSGPGIPADIRQRIFEPFFTTKPVGKGTGLGLSISYGIIKKHNGIIDIESTSGKGAIFTIRIPKT